MNFASPYIELPKAYVEQNLEVYARLYGVSEVKKNKRINCGS